MTLEEFRLRLKELHKKAKMDECLDWPFVYDEDEEGRIFVNSDGTFFFADKYVNWVASHLNIKDIVNMRYSKYLFDEPGFDHDDGEPEEYESYIYIYFASEEQIELLNRPYSNGEVEVYVRFISDEKKAASIKELREKCTCNEMRFRS